MHYVVYGDHLVCEHLVSKYDQKRPIHSVCRIQALWGAFWFRCNNRYNRAVQDLNIEHILLTITLVGANIIIETFFLHDRGKCFMVYTACILLGSAAGGTLSGFIIQTAPWPIQFWYNVGLEALVAVLCILLLDETGWTRPGGEQYPQPPTSFMKRKLATYTFTQRLRPHKTPRQMIHLFIKPLYIGLYPVTILVGLALSILFSWSVITVTAISLFLQTPVEEGGYGFTPYQNAYCKLPDSTNMGYILMFTVTFTFWLATAIAQVYGHFVNDRLPLYICSRNGGVWKPEYRLHALWFPVFFVYPIALGLFGATLYNHWHFMVLAVSNVCLNYCGACITGPTMNYIVEAVRPDLANEAAAMMNLYRLAFSLGLPFYIFPWISQVGQNWTFGMMAFFTIFTYGLIITVINFGEKIRTWNFLPEIKLEDSVKVI
jgi:hypothetical protein